MSMNRVSGNIGHGGVHAKREVDNGWATGMVILESHGAKVRITQRDALILSKQLIDAVLTAEGVDQ